jgi:hypothetical protein
MWNAKRGSIRRRRWLLDVKKKKQSSRAAMKRNAADGLVEQHRERATTRVENINIKNTKKKKSIFITLFI